jgi:hypothetical protein
MTGMFWDKHRRHLVFGVLCVGYLVSGAIPLTIGVIRPGITGYERAMLEDMVYGRAYRPFVKRQLVPLMVRAGKGQMPTALEEWLKNKFAGSSVVARLDWPTEYAVEFVLTLLVMYGSLIGFLIVLRFFLLCFLNISYVLSHVVVLAVGIGLPVTFAGQLYIYDFTQLLLFTASVLLLFRERWSLFIRYISCHVSIKRRAC